MEIRNEHLAEQGRKKIQWAARSMPVLSAIKDRFREEKPPPV